MDITRICILGAGKMGAGISHLAASSGFDVMLKDIQGAKLQQALMQLRRKQKPIQRMFWPKLR